MSSKLQPQDDTDFMAERLRKRQEWFAKSPEERAETERKWQIENAEAIQSMNEWVEKNGLPLAKYRLF